MVIIYSTVQYSTVTLIILRRGFISCYVMYSTVQYSTVKLILLYSRGFISLYLFTVQDSTVKYSTVQYSHINLTI